MRFVGQATPADLSDESTHPVRVGFLPRGVTEVELCKVTPQVLLGDVVVRAVNRTLQLREVPFGVVRGHITADPLAGLVVDRLVTGELVLYRNV